MSPAERAKLAMALAAIDEAHPIDAPRVQFGTRRWLVFTVIACLLLAAWIGVLAVTLPRHFTARAWRGAWVGFDGALLVAFATTAWAAWRRRRLLIACLIVTATLLCCDAWFDLTLDWGTHAFVWSLLSAVLVEVPIAVFMFLSARRLLRLTIRVMMARQGEPGPVPPLWRLALFWPDPGTGAASGQAVPARVQPDSREPAGPVDARERAGPVDSPEPAKPAPSPESGSAA